MPSASPQHPPSSSTMFCAAFLSPTPLTALPLRHASVTSLRLSHSLRPRFVPCAVHRPNNHNAQSPLKNTLLSAVAAASFFLPLPTKALQPLSLASSPITTQQQLKSRQTPRLATATAVTLSPAPRVANALLPRRIEPAPVIVAKVALLAGIMTVIITAATIAVFWVIQDRLVYKPTKVWRGSPKSSGMPYYDEVRYCTIDGVEISGWFIRQPATYRNARTMIYFHGTDKNASFRLKKVIGFYETCRCNVLLLSYRGYGLSTGKPNERGVRIDAESAYEYLRSRGDVDVGPGGNLWVYGESLGGAVAVYFSQVYEKYINALILENTFTSLLDMIKLEFPILGVFRYLSRNRWQSKKRIGGLEIPLLFLSGLKDSYIPPQMMRQMHRLAVRSPLKEFVEFEGGTHNRTWTMDGFYDAVAQFMDRVEQERGATVKSGLDDRIATAT